MTASRISHSTSSNGCVPSVVKYLVNVRPVSDDLDVALFRRHRQPLLLSANDAPALSRGVVRGEPHRCDYGSVILDAPGPDVNMMCQEFLSHTTCSVPCERRTLPSWPEPSSGARPAPVRSRPLLRIPCRRTRSAGTPPRRCGARPTALRGRRDCEAISGPRRRRRAWMRSTMISTSVGRDRPICEGLADAARELRPIERFLRSRLA